MRLSTGDHDRYGAGLTYVYPVVSRRARGVSVGVNLNPNDACNWRCVYCQVPGLVHGKGPAIDLALLERELDRVLGDVVRGDFMERLVPEGSRRLNDVAFSGNGEPTSSPSFPDAVRVAREALERLGVARDVALVLITNGSLAAQPEVQRGLRELAAGRAEVWFKLDRGDDAGMEAVNGAHTGVRRQLRNLALCADLAPTWVQTCMFARRGAPPGEDEVARYLAALEEALTARVPLRGVLLYGIERPSHQPEAPELGKLPAAWLEALGRRVEALGLPVRVHP